MLPLLPRLLRFPQVLQQLAAGTVGEQEAVLLAPLLLPLADVRLEVLHLDDHLVLSSEFADAGQQLGGVHKVDGEHAEEIADHKGKSQIPGQPVQRVQDIGVNAEVVHGADRRPQRGERRADQPLNVAPLLAVVPQPDLHELQGHDTGDVLDDRHAQCHAREQQQLLPHRVHAVPLAHRGQQIQDAQTGAVQGHIGSHAEAGVDPFALRVGTGEKAAVQQLRHPAQRGADEKQICQRQKHIHGGGYPFLRK